MRVALVSPYSWTYPGGVTRHIEALATELSAAGHDVRVLAPFDPDVRRKRPGPAEPISCPAVANSLAGSPTKPRFPPLTPGTATTCPRLLRTTRSPRTVRVW